MDREQETGRTRTRGGENRKENNVEKGIMIKRIVRVKKKLSKRTKKIKNSEGR